MNIKSKIKVHFQLGRFFAVPYFLLACGLGLVLSGASVQSWNTWLILIVVMCSTAAGHAVNSITDFKNGLDSGEQEDRSVEKDYCGGQNLIEKGLVSLNGITWNAIVWYVLSAIALLFVGINSGSYTTTLILFGLWVVGMVVPFLYSAGKFTVWLHELSLGVGCGFLPALMAGFAVSNHPPVVALLLVGIIPAVVLSFAGLSLDEFPDAQANLKKGVKSVAFKIWEYSDWVHEDGWSHSIPVISKTENAVTTFIAIWPSNYKVKSYSLLQWYLTTWLLMLFGFQIFLIQIGILKSLTGIGFIMFPAILCSLVFLKKNFNRTAVVIVVLGAIYLALILVGQIFGG